MELQSQTQKSASGTVGVAGKIKEVLNQFLAAIDVIKKEHRAKINETLEDVDERKIKALKEKLRNL